MGMITWSRLLICFFQFMLGLWFFSQLVKKGQHERELS